ncbi:MAG: AEC family transporter, partial [Clostridiales bacterium]|nr:AEC family transporter [Clostridiales bacterium]
MDSLLVAVNVVLPLVILIGIGYLTQSFHLIPQTAYAHMNKLVFAVLLPCMLFSNIYGSAIEDIVNAKLLAFGVLSIVAVFLCGIPVAMRLTGDGRKRGVALQGIFRSNFVLYGFPVVQSLYGDRAGATALLIAAIVPVFNILAVVALEMFRGGKVQLKSILTNICKNPLIVSTAVAIAFSALGVRLPRVIESSLGSLTGAATPIALIILGGTFQKRSLGDNMRLLSAVAALKLLISPAIFLGLAVAMGFRGVELLTLVSLFGAPAAVSSFSMAQQMGGDSDLAAQNILITTVASIFTIFMWVSLFSHLKL